MQEQCRSTGGVEGGDDFATDPARFAETGDDDLALAVEDGFDGFDEIIIELVDESADGLGLVEDDFLSAF